MSGMYPFRSHLSHYIPHSLRLYPLHHFRETFLKLIKNIRSRQVQTRFTLLGQSKHLIEGLFLRRMAIESTIVFLNLHFLFFREPITLARFQFKLQLGIELVVINRRTINRFLHFDAKETTASRLIRQ